MVFSDVFELFVKQSPVAVMVRATLENALSAERLDALFAAQARRQRPGELSFSLVVDLLGTVVCGVRPSIHAAFQARSEEIGVSVKALYDKLRGMEPHVARELVATRRPAWRASSTPPGEACRPGFPATAC